MSENKYSCYQCKYRELCYLYFDLSETIMKKGAFLNLNTGEELEELFRPVAKYCTRYSFKKEI